MSKNTGVSYEQITQQIFQALHDQGQVKNINVQHNVVLQGRTLKHQIDVYWEYELGGIVYRAIVQAKDWAQAVSQNHLLAFKAILDDLPGQPRGIFVTRTGYQSGAKDFAEKHGILLYELRQPMAEDVEGRVMGFHLRLSAFTPNYSDVEPILDQDWAVGEYKRLGLSPGALTMLDLGAPADQMYLFDESGQNVGNFHEIIKSMFPPGYVELPKTNKEHLFVAPRFMSTGNQKFPRIKLLGIRATISVTREMRETILKGEDFIGFVMRDVIGDKIRFIDKKNRPLK